MRPFLLLVALLIGCDAVSEDNGDNGDYVTIRDAQNYILVSVERPEELERVARSLAGYRVMLLYRDASGDLHEWTPACSTD